MSAKEIFFLINGFLSGLILMTILSLVYFFGAEKTMMRKMEPVISEPHLFMQASMAWAENIIMKKD